MSLPTSVADVIQDHVVLQLESIDRMYMNLYQPRLQHGKGAAGFFRFHRGEAFATALVMSRMTRRFVANIEEFARQNNIPIVPFQKGQRKEDVFQVYLKNFDAEEGVVFIGKAQEKASVWRTEKRRNKQTGKTYPWLVRSTAMVNQYYFYCVDKDFGPFFLKFCSYFPYGSKLCINGHEYAKRQLVQRGIAFEALDNGILSCENPKALQRICDAMSDYKIDRLLRKWFQRLPHPFTVADRQAGYRYDVSILQSEFALTQVFDRPLSGRLFFEQVIRDNLDLGRPNKMQLIFGRRINRRTNTRYRTRLITEHVVPSLWIDFKSSSLKQYFKCGIALRTETTVNNARDFGLGRRLENLSLLRKQAFAANRRLLDVQQIQHDPTIGQVAFEQMIRPLNVEGQRVSGLRFGDETLLSVFTALLMFRVLLGGFSNKELRMKTAQLLAKRANDFTPGQMTYQLRRLRLRGLIERLPGTNRYQVTNQGLRIALFYTGSMATTVRPTEAVLADEGPSLQQRILNQVRRILQQSSALQSAA